MYLTSKLSSINSKYLQSMWPVSPLYLSNSVVTIFWLYYFLYIWEKVIKYMSKCDLCHKIKLSRHRSYKEMRQTLTSNQLWASIVINFIVKLSFLKKLLTEVFYNLILIIVNQLIKEVWFISYKKVSNTEELAYIFLRNVTALQDLSNKIISDRDKLFISNF